ncbi:MAG TPA: glycosyltransferase [Acidimicrobiales bacterium]|nr:glycosyltransferase [Acidimicrobiales bacterium]
MVSNVEDRFRHWAERVLEVADELVVCVDSASADGTLKLARSLADTVVEVEHQDVNQAVMDYGARLATGEWILWLDDDELLHQDFPDRVAPLLVDRSYTHYWQPCRWLVDDDGLAWIRTFPWYPNLCLRLFRNLGGVFHHAGRTHSPFAVAGDGRIVDDDALAIWHTVFLIRDRQALEAKVAHYRTLGVSCEEYYLLPEAGPLNIEHVDAGAIIREASPEARADAERRWQRQRGADREVPFVDSAALRRSYARHRRQADIFAAEYLSDETPVHVAANQGITAEVTVRNTSGLAWRTSGLGPGRVVLSHHWEHDTAGVLVRNGDVSLLPHSVEPGETVTVVAGAWAPYEPGRYTLVWDLLAEDINWFSDRGVTPRRVPVEVVAAHRRLARPRTTAELPPAAPPRLPTLARTATWVATTLDTIRSRSEMRGANVRPITPERILDSRDGSGVPGAVNGPLAAGGELRLVVAGHVGVPDTAIGIVGTVAVVDANYNGYLTIRPAGTSARTVSAYFTQEAPAASMVTVGFGDGPDHGALSLVSSDNWPGHIQVLMEVVAYLERPCRR